METASAFKRTSSRRVATVASAERSAFFAVASDGLWEFMDSQQVVDLIAHWLDHFDGDERMAECACHEMIKEAIVILSCSDLEITLRGLRILVILMILMLSRSWTKLLF